ncbi:hypothetical protein E3N88_11610 [Mikania micrantha]|uniref:BAG domain-containing protein n=1 Tax=Mikania micrantha TaxID=192012 RepID=A0A5N6PEZ0_9ASTR|nr:hypothetical protein E3N88_11610 [Mikania micrantha]
MQPAIVSIAMVLQVHSQPYATILEIVIAKQNCRRHSTIIMTNCRHHPSPSSISLVDCSQLCLMACSVDSKVLEWDVDGGFCTRFKAHKGVVTSIIFHPDPTRLLWWSNCQIVTVVGIGDGWMDGRGGFNGHAGSGDEVKVFCFWLDQEGPTGDTPFGDDDSGAGGQVSSVDATNIAFWMMEEHGGDAAPSITTTGDNKAEDADTGNIKIKVSSGSNNFDVEEIKENIEEISRGLDSVNRVREENDQFAEQVVSLEIVVCSGTQVADKDFSFLTEMLMRQLLKLDGIDAEGEGRIQRKLEVRRVQGLVEILDNLRAKNSNPNSNVQEKPEEPSSPSSKVYQEWELS